MPTLRRTLPALGVLLAGLVLSGCGVAMPDSGPVREISATGSNRDDEPASIDPPGPQSGQSPEEILRGFLYAMRATPAIRTSVAREFLTREASVDWQPAGMVIYDSVNTLPAESPRTNNTVDVQLDDAYRIDARGAWLGPVAEADATVPFQMELNDGEWRISAPPPYLMVTRSWFEQRFRQASLYFFDPSATLLVPEPVYVPRGRQFASSLVNGLLQGPSTELSEADYLPSDLRSISVPVSQGGVAEVDLTSDAGDVPLPTPEQADLLVSQLAWTLAQDASIARFRVSIDGRQILLPGQSAEFSVEHGHEYAPYVAGSSTLLFGVRSGVMVGGSPQNLQTVTGPFGSGDYALGSVSVDLRADQAAAVSQDGHALWVAPVKDNGGSALKLKGNGENLLRPAWDFSGRLWEVDRRASGAEVMYRRGDQMRTLEVPGISGEDVKDFLVSRDGSRLIAVIRESAESDRMVVSRILTTGDHQVVGALAAETITPEDAAGPIRDVSWRTPTSVAMLYPTTRTLFQVRVASVDGAPSGDSLSAPIEGEVLGLAGTPVPGETNYAVVRGGLVDLDDPLEAASEIDPTIDSLHYVG
ncbi:LpqB family beta-propeller domain-containing protein [uncultured Nocardioides sp.]|uniref:LpqB family beta-propeller domain-containing protein n=1 Tax=uncultured Nocardioides sp. TaxID=198441 RepID=UPI0026193D93|nr:LpqB family beta-propeller domain-containing protein [uncultured Nocardioides sp.]